MGTIGGAEMNTSDLKDYIVQSVSTAVSMSLASGQCTCVCMARVGYVEKKVKRNLKEWHHTKKETSGFFRKKASLLKKNST